ncbi:MAG: lactonase family protein [Clostridiales bacterium]|nr:lactonase family protein [Clostridiales bacterium]
MKVFISGYGGGDTNSIGLYDLGNGGNERILLWKSNDDKDSNIEASSFLSIHENLLFGITEKQEGSSVHMFSTQDNTYQLLESSELKGDMLCHISYLPKNKILVGGCYGSGDVFSIEVGKDGFGKLLSHLTQKGDVQRQTRAHCVVSDQQERRLYSANIALDRVYFYNICKGNLIEDGYLQLDKGEGPRHIILYPELDLMYIITEYSNKIIIVDIGKEKSRIVQKISTLPKAFNGESYCSTLCITKDRRFLYGANRGANTIGVFKVGEDGLLEMIGNQECFGDWPRHIELLGDDDYIAIANQKSNEVAIAKRDKTTGLITDEVYRIEFPSPSFVQEKV